MDLTVFYALGIVLVAAGIIIIIAAIILASVRGAGKSRVKAAGVINDWSDSHNFWGR